MRRAAASLAFACLALLAACGEGDNSERDASQQPQGASLRVTIGTQAFP